MKNIYLLSDAEIVRKVAEKIKETRLKQNLSQAALSKSAEISLSTLARMEDGDIKTFDNLLRVLRTLGKLDPLGSLIEEESISPSEYFKLKNAGQRRKRLRAKKSISENKEEVSEW